MKNNYCGLCLFLALNVPYANADDKFMFDFLLKKSPSSTFVIIDSRSKEVKNDTSKIKNTDKIKKKVDLETKKNSELNNSNITKTSQNQLLKDKIIQEKTIQAPKELDLREENIVFKNALKKETKDEIVEKGQVKKELKIDLSKDIVSKSTNTIIKKEQVKKELKIDLPKDIANKSKDLQVIKTEEKILNFLPKSATRLPALPDKPLFNENDKIFLTRLEAEIYTDDYKIEPDTSSIGLLELYDEALKNNPNWKAQQAQNLAIKERENQAYAGLLPSINFSGSYNKSFTKQKNLNPNYNYTQDYNYDSYNYSFSFRQPLLRKYNIELYKQSKLEVNRADLILEQELQELAVKISKSYFDVLLAKANLLVSKMQEHSYKVYLDYANKAFEGGVGTKTDIDEAKAKLDNETANQIQLQFQYRQALNILSTLTKRNLESIRDLNLEKVKFIPPKPNNLEAWVQRAFLTNPSILAAQEDVKIANKEIDKAKSGHYPTLDIVAHATKSQSDTSSTINNQYNTSAIGLQLNIPIFDGGRITSQVKEAGHMLNNKQALLDASYDEIKLQVNREFDMINQSLKWIKAYQTSLKSAKQVLISTQKGFQAGTRNRLDILNAQQNLANIKLNLNKSIYDYINARIKLLALSGQMDSQQIGYFNTWIYE